MANPIKIYSIPTCPHSFNAKREYSNSGVPYEDIDVRADRAALEEMLKWKGESEWESQQSFTASKDVRTASTPDVTSALGALTMKISMSRQIRQRCKRC